MIGVHAAAGCSGGSDSCGVPAAEAAEDDLTAEPLASGIQSPRVTGRRGFADAAAFDSPDFLSNRCSFWLKLLTMSSFGRAGTFGVSGIGCGFGRGFGRTPEPAGRLRRTAGCAASARADSSANWPPADSSTISRSVASISSSTRNSAVSCGGEGSGRSIGGADEEEEAVVAAAPLE
jgi:hypothetical protein